MAGFDLSAQHSHFLHRPQLHLQIPSINPNLNPHQPISPDSKENNTSSSSQEPTKDSDGATTSASLNRRPRGRPAGSKNKPKPPIIVTRGSPNALRSHVLEVTAGADIVETVSYYARKKGRGICILSGNGTVANVTIKQPASPSGSVLTLHGRFDILSLTGAVLPPPAPPGAGGLSIFLPGGGGQIVGGTVVGPLLASGPVVLMASSFANAVFERLPQEEEEEEGGVQVQQQASASQSSGVTGGGGQMAEGGGSSGGVGFHNMGSVGIYPFSGDLFGWSGVSGVSRPTPY